MRILVAGSGRSCQENALALDAVGAEVALRTTDEPQDAHLKELATKSFPGGCDVLFEHVEPKAQEYARRGGLNVGWYADCVGPVPESISLLDAQCVPSIHLKTRLAANPLLMKPVYATGVPCDPARYDRRPEPPEAVAAFGRGRFLFYNVGDWCRRHNQAGLLKAFWAEFREEPVGLVLKSGLKGKGSEAAAVAIAAEINNLRPGAGLATQPPVLVLTERLGPEELDGLHRRCDCYVSSAYATAWNRPAFDAMAFGKTPIVPGSGGFSDYVDDEVGWALPCWAEPVFAGGATVRQAWAAPDLFALRAAMRAAYEDAALRSTKASLGRARAEWFSFSRVGARLLGVFDEQVGRVRRLGEGTR